MKNIINILILLIPSCVFAQTTTQIIKAETDSGIVDLAWKLEGNAGTTPLDFLGTTDLMPLKISTNNVERMRVSQTGDVGIGTETPTVKLHVNTGNTGAYFTRNAGDNGVNAPAFGILTSASDNRLGASGNLSFRVGNVGTALNLQPSRMTILATNGNVGIGTDAPADRLEIIGLTASIRAADSNPALRFYSGSGYAGITRGGAFGDFEHITINGSNVGIGLASPAAKLHVNGNVKIATTPVQTSTVGKTFLLRDDATQEVQSITAANFLGESAWTLEGNAGTTPINFLGTTDLMPLRIRTNNIERMIVSDAGNVGIGTSSPTSKLTVDGGAGSGFVSNIFGSRPNNGFIAKFQNTGNNANGVIIDISSGFINGKELLRFTDRDVFLASIDANAVTNTANGINFKTNNVVDAVSIDNTTFTVDALNNRVGINTDAPATNLHVVGNASITNTPTQTSTTGKTILLKDDATDEIQEITADNLINNQVIVLEAIGSYGAATANPSTNPNLNTVVNIILSLPNTTVTTTGNISTNIDDYVEIQESGRYSVRFWGNQEGNLSNTAVGEIAIAIRINNTVTAPVMRYRNIPDEPLSFYLDWEGDLAAGDLIDFVARSVSGSSASNGIRIPDFLIRVKKI